MAISKSLNTPKVSSWTPEEEGLLRLRQAHTPWRQFLELHPIPGHSYKAIQTHWCRLRKRQHRSLASPPIPQTIPPTVSQSKTDISAIAGAQTLQSLRDATPVIGSQTLGGQECRKRRRMQKEVTTTEDNRDGDHIEVGENIDKSTSKRRIIEGNNGCQRESPCIRPVANKDSAFENDVGSGVVDTSMGVKKLDSSTTDPERTRVPYRKSPLRITSFRISGNQRSAAGAASRDTRGSELPSPAASQLTRELRQGIPTSAPAGSGPPSPTMLTNLEAIRNQRVETPIAQCPPGELLPNLPMVDSASSSKYAAADSMTLPALSPKLFSSPHHSVEEPYRVARIRDQTDPVTFGQSSLAAIDRTYPGLFEANACFFRGTGNRPSIEPARSTESPSLPHQALATLSETQYTPPVNTFDKRHGNLSTIPLLKQIARGEATKHAMLRDQSSGLREEAEALMDRAKALSEQAELLGQESLESKRRWDNANEWIDRSQNPSWLENMGHFELHQLLRTIESSEFTANPYSDGEHPNRGDGDGSSAS
ncbi:hypothetical protein BJX64DRAFT_288394 [Aspergillus heterothallicus]